MANKIFSNVGEANVSRSRFNLTHEVKFSANMGDLIPVCARYMLPGDHFKISNELLIRFQPMVAPLMHSVRATIHWFKVPIRLVWNKWEKYISKGRKGDVTIPIPKWDNSLVNSGVVINVPAFDGHPAASISVSGPDVTDFDIGALWDYLGYPIFPSDSTGWPTGTPNVNGTFAYPGPWPQDFKRRAYNLIWNEYYRSQDYQAPVIIDLNNNEELEDYLLDWEPGDIGSNYSLLKRSWQKDYFTASLPDIVRGVEPVLPLSGVGGVSFPGDGVAPNNGYSILYDYRTAASGGVQTTPLLYYYEAGGASAPDGTLSVDNLQMGRLAPNTAYPQDDGAMFLPTGSFHTPDSAAPLSGINNATIDLTNLGTVTLSGLRTLMQLQRWMERNMRGGVRYTEFLKLHWRVSPRDERLQRPEYVGGISQDIVISEVLKTSTTDDVSPQANMAGHGITAGGSSVGTCYAEEYCVLMGLLSVMPNTSYQQGFNAEDLYDVTEEWPFPEYAHLSDQAVIGAELFASTDDGYNSHPFGYIGRYDEQRYIPSSVRGLFRKDLAMWHLGRIFDSPPELNSDFLECNPDTDRVFAVSKEIAPPLLVNVANIIDAIRPLPVMAEPGLMDHV